MRKLNKRILAVLLVAVLTIGTVVSAMASDSLTGSGWWTNCQTSTAQTLEDGATVTFSVSITSDELEDGEYAAFCVEANDGTYYFTGTSDGDCWGAGTDTDGASTGAVVGGSYTVTISREGNNFTADIVDDATEASILANPMYLEGTSEFGTTTCYIMTQVGNLTVDVVEEEEEVVETVDELTGSGWWTNCQTSTAQTLEDGATVTFTVDISSDELEDGEYAAFCVEANDGAYYFTGTSDGDCWGAGTDTDGTSTGAVVGGSYTVTITRDGNNFTADIVDNATGESILANPMYLEGTSEFGTTTCYIMTQVGNLTVTVQAASAGDSSEDGSSDDSEDSTTASSSDDSEDSTTAAASDDSEETTTEAAADDTTATATDGTSITYTVTEEVTETGTADDVEITTAFSTNTGEVTTSGDFTLVYTFTNTSTGTLNYENFILEMVSEGVFLDVRADNYGWLYGQGEDDYLTFDVDTTDYDWDTWNAAMAAGAECTVTVVKEGAYIYVTVEAAGATFTATAYVEEYEDAALTVYLTGENVNLTNVSYTYTYTTTTTKTDNYSEVVTVSDVAITIESMSDGIDPNVVVNYDTYTLTDDEQAALEALWEGDLSYEVLDVYLTLDGEVYEIPDGESIQLKISFSSEADYGSALVLHYEDENGEWHVIVPDEVGDGYVIATFTSLSPIALIVGSSKSKTETETTTVEDETTTEASEDETTATNTDGSSAVAGGDVTTWMYFVLLAGAAAVCVVLAKKRVTE